MLANNLSVMFNKFKRRLHLDMLYPRLPEQLKMDHWIEPLDDSLMTFSRYFPHKAPFVVNDDTCVRRRERNRDVFYIKDEFLDSLTLFGVQDIDWTDTSSDNQSISQFNTNGVFTPRTMGLDTMVNSFIAQQSYADTASLFNSNIFLEFEEPNKIIPTRVGSQSAGLTSFVVNLLVKHPSIVTISPTKMETFESLAIADLAEFLYGSLKYFDGLDTLYININLLLDHIQSIADTRANVIDTLENSYVSAANDNIPLVMTIFG